MVHFKSSTGKKVLTISAALGMATTFAALALAETGNILTEVIEIDDMANLVDDGSGGMNGGSIDWVVKGKEMMANKELVPGTTAHAQGTGYWNGLRVVDSAGSGEKDIFLGGSSFFDPAHWSVGQGNIGGAKFDAGQAYLANNAETLFMGMERLGFNGTTAWDFEFNAKAPDPEKPYTPNRSPGDKLLVFEMNGSGGSAYVDVFLWVWGEDKKFHYIGSLEDDLPYDILATINDDPVAAGPWGYRDTKGQWKLGQLPALTFAEVAVPIGDGGIELTEFNANDCSNSAYVAIRTRASNEFSSALKDAIPIFKYQFSGLTVKAEKTTQSAKNLNVTLTGTISSGNPDKQWQVFDNQKNDWVPIDGQTDAVLTFPSGDFDFDYPYCTTKYILEDEAFKLDETYFIGQVHSTRLRLQASQTVSGKSCTVNSNEITVKDLVAVDP